MNENSASIERKPTRSELRQAYKTSDPFTPEELRECYIIKRMSQKEIAAHFHCEVHRVIVAMRREGITRKDKTKATKKLYPNQPKPQKNKGKGKNGRRGGIPKYPFTREELLDLYIEQKMNTREIGEKVGVTRTVVSRYLKLFGIPARGPKQPPRRNEKSHYKSALNQLYCAYRYAAAARDYSFDLTMEQFESLVTCPCTFCGCPHSLKKGKYFFNGIDRSDSSLGYIISNVRPCCTTCNRAKNTMIEGDFIQWILRVAKHLGSNPQNDLEVAG